MAKVHPLVAKLLEQYPLEDELLALPAAYTHSGLATLRRSELIELAELAPGKPKVLGTDLTRDQILRIARFTVALAFFKESGATPSAVRLREAKYADLAQTIIRNHQTTQQNKADRRLTPMNTATATETVDATLPQTTKTGKAKKAAGTTKGAKAVAAKGATKTKDAVAAKGSKASTSGAATRYAGKKIKVLNKEHGARPGTKRANGMDIILKSKTTDEALEKLVSIEADSSFIRFAVEQGFVELV